MAKKLEYPSLPAGAIVSQSMNNDDKFRNDGVRLKPANENPWYVLATIAGEQGAGEFDEALAEKNRRYWNGWVCQNLSGENLTELAEKLDENLDQLTSAELKVVKARFKNSFGSNALPLPDDSIDLSKTYFIKPMVLMKCVILGNANFSKCHFVDNACFSKSHFTGNSCLRLKVASMR